MARFDIYRFTEEIPFVIDIQADILSDLASVVVIPLAPTSSSATAPIGRLNPIVRVEDQDYMLLTTDIAAIPRSLLGVLAGNAASRRNDIVAAVDFLFQGF